jgi:chromosome segregation ATPase
VDVSQISTELQDTSGRLEEKSSSLTTISTKFARSEDDEKRSVARDLLKLRASLNELSNEIRTIADRLKGVR